MLLSIQDLELPATQGDNLPLPESYEADSISVTVIEYTAMFLIEMGINFAIVESAFPTEMGSAPITGYVITSFYFLNRYAASWAPSNVVRSNP